MPDLSNYDWNQLSPTRAPAARQGHAMIWDGTRVILFGGFTTSHNAETWKYESDTWTLLTPATSPTSRSYHRMVWDGSRILLFGGTRPGTGFLADTWSYSGGTWTQLSPATVPPGRLWHSMVWDGTRVLMYGGTTAAGSTPNDQTWEYVSGNWNLLSPANTPGTTIPGGGAIPGRLQHRMVWNGSGVVLFGGRSDNNVYPTNPANETSGNTWTYASANWTQAAPTGDPQLRYSHAMTVTDDAQAIMFGGDVSPTGSLGEIVVADTQVYEAGAWTNMAEGVNPGKRLHSDMVWDGDRVILFGGDFFTTPTSEAPVGDTWEYAGPYVARGLFMRPRIIA